jgi:rubrerythrin
MRIITNLVQEIKENGMTLTEIMRIQHAYHEGRRWSVTDVLRDKTLGTVSRQDKAILWQAARAEITTQPACIRLAVDGLKLANELEGKNKIGNIVAHSAAQWSARYWLEEEGHHEVAYGTVMEMAGLDPISEDEVKEYRGAFPTDNFARVCMLQACVEIEACVAYGEVARTSENPLVKQVFARITADESQHRAYFIAFARALVESDAYPLKDILSMAYTWIRPKGGETHGSYREKQTERKGFVNWWQNMKTDPEDELRMDKEQFQTDHLQEKKIRAVLSAVEEGTGIPLKTADDLQKAYMKSLTGSVRLGDPLIAA